MYGVGIDPKALESGFTFLSHSSSNSLLSLKLLIDPHSCWGPIWHQKGIGVSNEANFRHYLIFEDKSPTSLEAEHGFVAGETRSGMEYNEK